MSKTKEKYMNAMLYACAQPEFHSREFAKAFKISHNVITAMNELGLIQKVANGKYCWIIRREPLASDVVAIRKRLAAYNATARQSNGQLTIKAIKNPQHRARAQAIIDEAKRIVSERTQQVPDVDVFNHDRTNSKIGLAMIAGLIIGFMIATLIWK